MQIRQRLATRTDLTLLSAAADRRRDVDERRRLLNSADAVILCLPDDAAREAVSMVTSSAVRVLDASTAHQVWRPAGSMGSERSKLGAAQPDRER